MRNQLTVQTSANAYQAEWSFQMANSGGRRIRDEWVTRRDVIYCCPPDPAVVEPGGQAF